MNQHAYLAALLTELTKLGLADGGKYVELLHTIEDVPHGLVLRNPNFKQLTDFQRLPHLLIADFESGRRSITAQFISASDDTRGHDSRQLHITLPIAARKPAAASHLMASWAAVLQAAVVPGLYQPAVAFCMGDDATIEQDYSEADVTADAKVLAAQIALYYWVQWVERNNLRHFLGLTSDGYAKPPIALVSFYSKKIGDYADGTASRDLASTMMAAHAKLKPSELYYLMGEMTINEPSQLIPPIEDAGKTALNMSFGKESLFCYELLKHIDKAPQLITFGHDEGRAEVSDYHMRAFNLAGAERHFNLQSTYLPDILQPIGSQLRDGAPIHALFIPNTFAECAFLAGSETTHILFGDEYERNISRSRVNFGGGEEVVYTYDFIQTDRWAIAFNSCKHELWPFIGSIMYNLTGAQAQMALDHLGTDILQTSCHASLTTGKNCGICNKCKRIAARKLVFGSMAGMDYSVTPEEAYLAMNWSYQDYYGYGDNYDSDLTLISEHSLMASTLNAMAYGIPLRPSWEEKLKISSCVTNKYVNLLKPAAQQQMAEVVREAANAVHDKLANYMPKGDTTDVN